MNSKDYSISFVRYIAMIFIIVCHIFQYYNNELAFWFNVGVQTFLFISGWLYANKKIDNKVSFYLKQFKKIIIPYYIYFIIISFVYIYISDITFIDFFKGLFFIDSLNGIKHLWFIRYILLCYLLLPFFQKQMQSNKNVKKNIVNTIILIITFEIIGILSKNFINGTWINCFILGLLFRYYENYVREKALIYCTTLIFNIIAIILKYFISINLSKVMNIAFNKYFDICHMLLGISLFFILIMVYKKINLKMYKILDWSDKYSFYVYITHHIYILGPLSLFLYINNFYLALICLLLLTLISSIVLKKISEFIIKKI